MSFTDEQIAALKAPLNSAKVKQRSQAGRSLSYIEGWHAIDEANRIFGFGMWNRHTQEMRLLSEPVMVGDKWRVYYAAKALIQVGTERGDIIREGWGYGSGIDKDVGQAHESAIKEAETDAMKRALMTFGNPFGLALYDKEQRNVAEETKPAPAPVFVTNTDPSARDALTIANTLVVALELSKSIAELTQWLTDNRAAVDGLTADARAIVEKAYKAKFASLKYARAA